MRRLPLVALAFMTVFSAACSRQADKQPAPSQPPDQKPLSVLKMNGPLVASNVTMVAAWEFPKNPLTDKSLDDSRQSQEIRKGFKLFTNTPVEAPHLAPGGMSCSSCHMNAGQREKSLPLVAVAGMFPEYNRRSGRMYSLGDRVTDCFLRSENATGVQIKDAEPPSPTSPEVLAISAYLMWLGRGTPSYVNPTWRGQNAIAAKALLPIDKLDPKKGEAIYTERCMNCHGVDGQGVKIGDKAAGPLWGPNSWNDGAGAARVYTLAGMIRYSMPYLDPGNISDEDAQHVAAFINSKPRPVYPYKDRDYKVEKLPVDAVYYTHPQTPEPSHRGTN
jgi:thiosulfate dehydrogenase